MISFFESGGKESEYVIHQIDGTNIYIIPIDGEDLSLIRFDDPDWVIDGAEETEFRFEPEPFTIQDVGGPYPMINILAQLDYLNLMEMCNTNQEINRICQLDEVWRPKLLIDFGFDIPTNKPLRQMYLKLYNTEQNVYGANQAADRGNLEVLQWLSNLDPPILPARWAANRTARNGHLEVLKWLNNLDPPILPTQRGANRAAKNGHLEILEWLATLDPPILPSREGVKWAAMNGHLEVLKWLSQLDPPILPTQREANWAAIKGHPEILEWYQSLGPSILSNY